MFFKSVFNIKINDKNVAYLLNIFGLWIYMVSKWIEKDLFLVFIY